MIKSKVIIHAEDPPEGMSNVYIVESNDGQTALQVNGKIYYVVPGERTIDLYIKRAWGIRKIYTRVFDGTTKFTDDQIAAEATGTLELFRSIPVQAFMKQNSQVYVWSLSRRICKNHLKLPFGFIIWNFSITIGLCINLMVLLYMLWCKW